MDFRTNALAPLTLYPQWVAWRIEPTLRNGVEVPAKIPYSPIHGGKASSTNPADWSRYDDAVKYATATGMGVGFVFTASDPFFFLDVDKALHAGQWSQLAQELCARFAGAAVEVSQSGTGLHIIGMYSAQPEHRKKNVPLGLELYTQERFVALTGINAMGDATALMDAPLAATIAQYFDPTQVAAGAPMDWTTEPVAEWSGPEDDDELLARALKSEPAATAAAAFGGGSTPIRFSDLWNANGPALAAKFPGNNGAEYDASSADQALANMLAFWTGKNCERMERMMTASCLRREKWDDRPDYLQTTILKAVAFVKQVYAAPTAKPAAPPPPAPTQEAAQAAGFKLRMEPAVCGHDAQMALFAGCIYVSGPHKILTPRGELLDRGRFDAVYGGWEFILSIDGKSKTTSAWEAFTQAQTWAPERADRLCFRPEHGAGGVIHDGGKRLANAYVPAVIDMVEGDPGPFVRHMHKMLPEGDDCEILLTYMASVAQNPGMKAQWWPVVQGAQGNFKSTLLDIMSHAVGTHYSHMPNMKKMVKGDSNFNGWIERKLFLGLDEVYAADRREFFEGFKTTVTNLSLAVEGKGVEEITTDNRANGMIVTNHQDGVPISGDNRRYAPFFCAQQTPEDMLRDGMNNEYITDLSDWLRGRGKYASGGPNYGVRVMAHHLHTRALHPAYNPVTCVRAPLTTSTDRAIHAGLGRVEQEIEEAIASGEPGFAGGWVSAHYLKALLARERLSLPRGKFKDVLGSMGYQLHPALVMGRTNAPVQPDGKKVQLFCKVGSIAWNSITEPAAVAAAYSKAQSVGLEEATRSQFNG